MGTSPTGYKLMRRLQPGKTGVFSRRQTCRGKSQSPVVWIAGWRETKNPEAHRQGLPWGDYESPGRNDSERKCGLERLAPRAEPASVGRRQHGMPKSDRCGIPPRRGESDSTVTRTCRVTGEALLVPVRNHRSKVDRITGQTGKSIEGERVADGSVVATKRGNARGAKGPCCL